MIEEKRNVKIIKKEIGIMRITLVASMTIELFLTFVFFNFDINEWDFIWSNAFQQLLGALLAFCLISPIVLVCLNRELKSLEQTKNNTF